MLSMLCYFVSVCLDLAMLGAINTVDVDFSVYLFWLIIINDDFHPSSFSGFILFRIMDQYTFLVVLKVKSI